MTILGTLLVIAVGVAIYNRWLAHRVMKALQSAVAQLSGYTGSLTEQGRLLTEQNRLLEQNLMLHAQVTALTAEIEPARRIMEAVAGAEEILGIPTA